MPVAIITGATDGIGKAVAEKLLLQGIDIAFCARNEAKLDSVTSSWQEKYPERKILSVKCDVSIKDEIETFANKAIAYFGSIDILVNNAGIFLPGELATEPTGRLEALMSTNLFSAYYLSRAVIPLMKKNNTGHIFNICSVASLKAYPNGGAYSVTKYALLGFSDNLREELKPYNIKVTAISPGATYTNSWSGSGVAPERIMEAADVAEMLWSAYNLSSRANVEQIVMRPVKGDL